MDVEVKVPATVANLGPGFDCLGVAVGVHLKIRFGPSEISEVAGEATPLPRNLIHRSFVAAHEAATREPPPVRIEVLEAYPSARGLGASASAIIAGLAGARLVGDLPLTDEEIARLAIRLEGHADNVLPAFFGGLVLASGEGWMRFEPAASISPVILVARGKSRTDETRRILPAEVPRADAVANAAASAALVTALTGGLSSDALMVATEDRLHEPYRLPYMQESLDLHTALRQKGIAATLAGAGPSLVCLVEAGRSEEIQDFARNLVPEGWDVIAPGWDLTGAQVR